MGTGYRDVIQVLGYKYGGCVFSLLLYKPT